jgi:hypothetical protein
MPLLPVAITFQLRSIASLTPIRDFNQRFIVQEWLDFFFALNLQLAYQELV